MIIGLNGKKGSGKDTVFKLAREICHTETVVRIAFADKLKQSAAASLGVTVEQLEEWKNSSTSWVSVKEGGAKVQIISIRNYLQWYGTEAHRDVFGSDFWVDQALPLDFDPMGRIVFVTDVRFPNEIERVNQLGGEIWRVVGPDDDVIDQHPSEQDIPDEKVDVIIDNSVRNDGFVSLDMTLRGLLGKPSLR